MRPYIHHVQGRLRIRCLSLKRNQAQADQVRKILESQAGIRACEVNILTGSVLIHYDEAFTSADGIVGYFKGMGYTSDAGEIASISHPRHSSESKLGRTKEKITGAVANALFEHLLERSAIALIRAVL